MVALSNAAAASSPDPSVPQTLDRALAVLSLFQSEAPEWGAAAVARELGLTLPTASRFLRALERRGFLMRVDSRRYRLGFGAVELGFRALRLIDVRERLRPVLVGLAGESGETCLLATITESRDAARVIDRADGRGLVRISLEIGHTWPLHAGALAKALLAFMPDRDVVLAQGLVRLQPNTVTDPVQLLEELDAIRRQGWARSQEETDVGVWGVATAVLDAHGLPVAGIGLISPLERMTDEHERRLVEQLARAVESARARLGFRTAQNKKKGAGWGALQRSRGRRRASGP